MKQICVFLFCLIAYHVKSQQLQCPSSNFCAYNLADVNPPFGVNEIDSIKNMSYAKANLTTQTDPEYAKDDCAGLMNDCTNDADALIFDVYFPKKTSVPYSSTCKLPFVLMFHGGGYKECSHKDADVMVSLCNKLARQGFIAFNCEYRGGSILDFEVKPPIQANYIKTVQQQLAVARAVQDVLGAERSICKMEDNNVFGNSFRIDKNEMFVGGQSAGSGAVLTASYLQTSGMVNAASPGIFSAIGGLKVDYYYAQSNYATPTVKGVWDMWGEFPMPGDKNNFTKQYNFFSQDPYIPPVISFHGDSDIVATITNRKENYSVSNGPPSYIQQVNV